jgi:phosphate transport system substrate-binding protein
VVVHRSDGSGTTNNFTKFLVAAGGSDWTLGSGDTVNWPADTQAGDKNPGVAQAVQAADGAIGYVDYADAMAAGLVTAAVKNKDGNFVKPTLEGAVAALAGAELEDDLTYNPLYGPGADAYPITAATYLLVRPSYDDAEEGAAVKGFVRWLLTDGRDYADELGFAVLPPAIQVAALAKLDTVTVG